MTITDPAALGQFKSDWTAALTNLVNGLYQNRTVVATGSLTLGITSTDVPGCTASFSVVGANAFVWISAMFEMSVSASSAGVLMEGRILIDGAPLDSSFLGPIALLKDNGANTLATASASVAVDVTAGSHTVTLQGLKSAALGTHQIVASNTYLSIVPVDLP